MKLSNQKGRAWAFVMYPESMPDNYFELLEQTGLPFAISPLHDKDLDPTGQPKKPHYHVMCYYDNTTTKKNVKENVCDLVNGTIPIKLESMRGMYRYHLHLDNPDKYQYDDRDRTFRSLPSDSKNMTEEEYKRELGIRLRQMMEHRGVTQIDLSEMTGLSQAQISSYITGKVSPSFYIIDRIAKALDCSSDLLRYNFKI